MPRLPVTDLSAQRGAAPGGRAGHRFGRRYEVGQNLGKVFRIELMWPVTATGQDLQAATGQFGVSGLGVRTRDRRVVLAGDQQRRQVAGEVQPTYCGARRPEWLITERTVAKKTRRPSDVDNAP
ncbi:MAG: hypothetical protein M3443_17565 [Actinomycetota bacterium]|nr:hypothetical protein [Actinomycetota bacterium]